MLIHSAFKSSLQVWVSSDLHPSLLNSCLWEASGSVLAVTCLTDFSPGADGSHSLGMSMLPCISQLSLQFIRAI